MVGDEGRQPFFTIGVPTYDRHDLLRETLEAILSQSFTDFEVIVGNDFTAETLTGEMLGISDPRVCFVNHPRNLREVGNMNALLAAARGRYFTWLFDDDLYEPDFLLTAHDHLVASGYPQALFPSFRTIRGTERFEPQSVTRGTAEELTGREFLRRYTAVRPYVISTCGLFDTRALRSRVGGVEELCPSAIGLYCEYLFLVRCALLERIVHVDAPLVIFRVHPDSWGESNTDLSKYVEAGKELLRRSAEALRHPSLAPDLGENLMTLCKIHLYTFATKSAMYEVAGKRFGVTASCRAIGRFLRETGKILNEFTSLNNGCTFSTRVRFMKFEIYCCRLILFKLRLHRRESQRQVPE